jgi:hypothetical protein
VTKRHHATNYHRCSECKQPLVKERTICYRCVEKAADRLAEIGIEVAKPIEPIYMTDTGLCPECGMDDFHKMDCSKAETPVAVQPEPEVFRP